MESNNIENISTYEYQKIQIIKKKIKNYIIWLIILILTILLYKNINYLYSKQEVLEDLQKEKENIENQITFLQNLEKQVKNLKDTKKKCLINPDQCPDYIKNYILIKKFEPKNKMDYDQTSILEDMVNLSYMNIIYAKINSISFGKPKEEKVDKYKFIKLPITVNIITPNYNSTKNLLYQIENNIKLNNLYNIQNIKYDIVKSGEPQNMTLNLEVIYYK